MSSGEERPNDLACRVALPENVQRTCEADLVLAHAS